MSTTTTTAKPELKRIKIALSDRPPVTIVADIWPVVAHDSWHDGEVECQANRRRYLKVREHADGRRIVYGGFTSQWRNERDTFAGYLIPAPQRNALGGPVEMNSSGQSVGLARQADETIRAIRRVAGAIGDDELASSVIADLPAEDI